MASCGSVIVPEERCGQLQWRTQHVGDDRTIGWSAGPAADVDLSNKFVLHKVEPERRSYVSPLEPNHESQMLDGYLILKLGFILICL